MDMNSEQFLASLRAREPKAFEQVVRRYTEHLLKAALGLGFAHEHAHDLVQNCWATFFDVAPRFEGKSHLRTFIFGILYNKAYELRRENTRADTSGEEIENILNARFDAKGNWITQPVNAESFLIASETMALIKKCIDALPVSQRMAFSLKEIEEEETKEICNILEFTNTNLGVILYRARNQLRECVEAKSKRSRKA
jgi:RNA polymerase sigma-70 factor (ECF subfamily)